MTYSSLFKDYFGRGLEADLPDPASINASPDTAAAYYAEDTGVLYMLNDIPAWAEITSGGGGGAPANYVKLGTVTLGADGNIIEFTGIDQSYDDLVLVTSLRGTDGSATTDISMKFNGSADGYAFQNTASYGGSNDPYGQIGGAGTFAGRFPAAGAPANYYSSSEITIMRYASGVVSKNGVARGGARGGDSAGNLYGFNTWISWASTDPITSISLHANFKAGSQVVLYGRGGAGGSGGAAKPWYWHPPQLADFTDTINSPNPSYNDNVGMNLYNDDNGNVNAVGHACDAADWQLTAHLIGGAYGSNAGGPVIVCYNTAKTKIYCWGKDGRNWIHFYRMTPTGWDGFEIYRAQVVVMPEWWRLRYTVADGVLRCDYSYDGVTWIANIYTRNARDEMGGSNPTFVGFAADTGACGQMSNTCDHYTYELL